MPDEKDIANGYVILKGLRYENLLRIFDIYDYKKHTHIVMELADESLDNLLEARRLTKDESAFVILQILLGLSYLHSMDVMHRYAIFFKPSLIFLLSIRFFFRDLKPPNILIRGLKNRSSDIAGTSIYDLTFVIADYDFARVFAESEADSTVSMSVVGTLIYTAPEIRDSWKQERAVPYTETADIFSLGVMCYQIITGTKPEQIEGTVIASFVVKLDCSYCSNCIDSSFQSATGSD